MMPFVTKLRFNQAQYTFEFFDSLYGIIQEYGKSQFPEQTMISDIKSLSLQKLHLSLSAHLPAL